MKNNTSRLRRWFPFLASLLAVALVTGGALAALLVLQNGPAICLLKPCTVWTTLALPLFLLLLLWLIAVTGLMALVVRFRPWRRCSAKDQV